VVTAWAHTLTSPTLSVPHLHIAPSPYCSPGHFSTPTWHRPCYQVLSAGTSPYMPIVLMRDEPMFRRFFSFETATEAETQRWVPAIHLGPEL